MIIYRPHRATLENSLKEAKEFETEEEMKYYIMRQYKEHAECMAKWRIIILIAILPKP